VPPLQAAMVPSSVTKIKRAPPKSGLPLKTIPVGVAAPVGGIVTVNASFCPAPLYSVETPVPLSATHHGLVELDVRPHGLTRLGSVSAANPGTSETRFVC